MRSSSYFVLQGFIEKYSKDRKEKLISFFPYAEKKLPEELHIDQFSPTLLLDYVHYSWFLPTLNTYSKKEKALFISSLDGELQKTLKTIFKVKPVWKKTPRFDENKESLRIEEPIIQVIKH